MEEESRPGIQANNKAQTNIYLVDILTVVTRRVWSHCFDLFRIFDKDGDGFVSKKEFKWMTANKRISQRKVDIMFEVRSLVGFLLSLTCGLY